MGAALTEACARRMDRAPSRLARALLAANIGQPLLASEVAAAQHAVQKDKGKGREGSSSSSEPADAETRKAVNDAVAYIRGLAELNGRNADWAADAVRSAVSLPASEALKLHVIDVIADDVPDLLRKIDGRSVNLGGKAERLATADLEIVSAPPDWRTELLAVITDPNVAFLLMLLGVY